MTSYYKQLNLLLKILQKNPNIASAYFQKWNITPDQLINTLNDPNFHGGAVSKFTSINNIATKKYSYTLDIGPETGIETFMLSEVSLRLDIADPDEDNLVLIKSIIDDGMPHYKSMVNYIPMGLGNSKTYEKENYYYHQITGYLKNSIPTYYHLTSKQEISSLSSTYDLIFVHKIASTITRSQKSSPNKIFLKSLEILYSKLSKFGILTWTEPLFFWTQQNINIPKKYNIKIIDYRITGSPDIFRQLIVKND